MRYSLFILLLCILIIWNIILDYLRATLSLLLRSAWLLKQNLWNVCESRLIIYSTIDKNLVSKAWNRRISCFWYFPHQMLFCCILKGNFLARFFIVFLCLSNLLHSLKEEFLSCRYNLLKLSLHFLRHSQLEVAFLNNIELAISLANRWVLHLKVMICPRHYIINHRSSLFLV